MRKARLAKSTNRFEAPWSHMPLQCAGGGKFLLGTVRIWLSGCVFKKEGRAAFRRRISQEADPH